MLKNEMRGKSKRRRIGSEEGSDPTGHSNLSELGGIVDPGLENKVTSSVLNLSLCYTSESCVKDKKIVIR